jgi:hypothetical protein
VTSTILLVIPKPRRTPTDGEIVEIRARTQAVVIPMGCANAVTKEECIAGLLELMARNDIRSWQQRNQILENTDSTHPICSQARNPGVSRPRGPLQLAPAPFVRGSRDGANTCSSNYITYVDQILYQQRKVVTHY